MSPLERRHETVSSPEASKGETRARRRPKRSRAGSFSAGNSDSERPSSTARPCGPTACAGETEFQALRGDDSDEDVTDLKRSDRAERARLVEGQSEDSSDGSSEASVPLSTRADGASTSRGTV